MPNKNHHIVNLSQQCSMFFISQVIPLLLVNSYEFGGYSMDPSALGVILMVSAIVQLFFQVKWIIHYPVS